MHTTQCSNCKTVKTPFCHACNNYTPRSQWLKCTTAARSFSASQWILIRTTGLTPLVQGHWSSECVACRFKKPRLMWQIPLEKYSVSGVYVSHFFLPSCQSSLKMFDCRLRLPQTAAESDPCCSHPEFCPRRRMKLLGSDSKLAPELDMWENKRSCLE